MHPPADPVGAKPRRDHRSLARVSRHEVPKTAGEDAKKDKRPRQGVALIRESCNQCDTLAGSLKALLGDPQGVEGVGKGLCTSVTASRMTDAYGASTLRVPHG